MSRSRATNFVLTVSSLLLASSLSACGGGDTVDQKSSTASADETDAPKKKEAKSVILETGFGQRDEYVTMPALVENKTDHGGQTVTVSFNLNDEKGELLKTESQVESFSYAGQKLAVVGFSDLKPGQKVGSVDATLLVEEDGIGTEVDFKIDPADAEFAKGEYGDTTATYTVENPTTKPLKDLRIGVICKGKDGKINGGGTDYPELVAPSGQIKLDTDVMVSGTPESCTAYIGPGL